MNFRRFQYYIADRANSRFSTNNFFLCKKPPIITNFIFEDLEMSIWSISIFHLEFRGNSMVVGTEVVIFGKKMIRICDFETIHRECKRADNHLDI